MSEFDRITDDEIQAWEKWEKDWLINTYGGEPWLYEEPRPSGLIPMMFGLGWGFLMGMVATYFFMRGGI